MSLFGAAFKLSKPFLHGKDAEDAHLATIRMLKCLPPLPLPHNDPILSQSMFGLQFPNPLGLAPGFDKNAEVPNAMLRMGFGFVEVGTLTPRRADGKRQTPAISPHRRQCVINRMGFNNEGHWRHSNGSSGNARLELSESISGPTRTALTASLTMWRASQPFSEIADYITINISSPNTPGLRGLQSAEELAALLKRLNEARATQSRRPAMLLKIAPDLGDQEMADIATCCADGAVDGVIISNTTLSRPELSSNHAAEAGGLSGSRCLSCQRGNCQILCAHQGQNSVDRVGGIEDGDTAVAKVRAGASLLQVYSAMVYRGLL